MNVLLWVLVVQYNDINWVFLKHDVTDLDLAFILVMEEQKDAMQA